MTDKERLEFNSHCADFRDFVNFFRERGLSYSKIYAMFYIYLKILDDKEHGKLKGDAEEYFNAVHIKDIKKRLKDGEFLSDD